MAKRLTDAFRLAIAQLNPVVGDVDGNLAVARAARAEAAAGSADIILFTELFLSGYPPEDLVLRPAFLEACREAVTAFAAETADGGPAVLIGAPWRDEGGVRNAMAFLDGGRIETLRYKVELPNYGVFDEKRVFAPGPLPEPVTVRGLTIGVPVCEDLWTPALCDHLVRAGATMLLVPNGSPYWRGKGAERHAVVAARVAETGVPVVYANMLGGQDELVFDGGSFGLHADRSEAFRLPQFSVATAFVDWTRDADGWRTTSAAPPHAGDDEADWRACVLGLRDYVSKNGFPGVILGLSGGIDSALVAAMATDALGAERVRCVMLPYRYTSSQSLRDAEDCARALGVHYDVMPIAGPVEAAEAALKPLFGDQPRGLAEENLQARTRGMLLMGLSNKLGPLLLSTGNKSEVSVGYATLYGDMNGGFNPIKDLYKTDVYRLARWRNANRPDGLLGPSGEVIPEAIIVRAPTAELRENQTDQDSLPPYDVLDAILADLIENERSVAEIVAKGHDPATVRRVEHLVAISEYKRRQAAPGVKISGRNFGRDRRYPITNRFREKG